MLHLIDLGGNSIDTASAAGRFMLTVLAGAAEMERNLARERTKAALAVKAKRGERYSGHAPYGLTLTKQGRLEADSKEQAIAKRIADMRRENVSYRRIAAKLNADGKRYHFHAFKPASLAVAPG